MKFKLFAALLILAAAIALIAKYAYTVNERLNNEAGNRLWEQTQIELVQGVLVPRYKGFRNALLAFRKEVELNCTQEKRAHFQVVVREVLLQWAAIESIQFGAIDEGMGHAKTYFWPDKHGAFRRHLKKLQKDFLQKKEFQVRSLPLTLTGLQALEFYFYAEDALWFWDNRELSCNFISEISDLHLARVNHVIQSWSSWNPDPQEPKKMIREFVQAFADLLERIQLVKISIPLEKRSPSYLEASHAQLHGLILRENYKHFFEIYCDENKYLGKALKTKNPEVFEKLQALAVQAIETSGSLKRGINALQNSSLLATSKSLHKYFLENVPGVLEVQLGFNAADGD